MVKKKQLSPEESCREAVRKIYAAVPQIVDTLIRQAKEGSCAHAKFLFEFAGVEVAPGGADEEDLGMMLLKQLQSATENATEAEPGKPAVP
jgi:hypothetical protein